MLAVSLSCGPLGEGNNIKSVGGFHRWCNGLGSRELGWVVRGSRLSGDLPWRVDSDWSSMMVKKIGGSKVGLLVMFVDGGWEGLICKYHFL